MARYLVTGCAGFIGSAVGELLLADGHTVIGVDNLNDAYDVRLKEWRLDRLTDIEGFTFHQLDISNPGDVTSIFEQYHTNNTPPFNGVINLAARAGVRQSVENPWVYVETNMTGTLNLLEGCRHHGVTKFVLASTSSLYGTTNPIPFKENANTDLPLSPYAASKKGAEALCHTYHHLYEVDVTILRYFTVYGPAGRPDMSLFRFTQWISEGRPVIIFGDGKQSRDFTYVNDIARGTIAALKPLGYEVINLGSDHPHELMEVVRLIEEMTGKTAAIEYQPMHRADMLATWADISKAKKLLGWKPQTTLKSGVEHLVNWYNKNQSWAKDVETV
jgi:nucleoside-diphosphate-sugar epimerase